MEDYKKLENFLTKKARIKQAQLVDYVNASLPLLDAFGIDLANTRVEHMNMSELSAVTQNLSKRLADPAGYKLGNTLPSNWQKVMEIYQRLTNTTMSYIESRATYFQLSQEDFFQGSDATLRQHITMMEQRFGFDGLTIMELARA